MVQYLLRVGSLSRLVVLLWLQYVVGGCEMFSQRTRFHCRLCQNNRLRVDAVCLPAFDCKSV